MLTAKSAYKTRTTAAFTFAVAAVLVAAMGSASAGEPKSFKDCSVCPEMVVVPAGRFVMGAANSEPDEQPRREIRIPRSFAVGKYEITFAEWDACFAAGGCKRQPIDYGWGRGHQPVNDVAWSDIMREYLPWLSKTTGKTYRLLTEAEWEYSARAGSQSAFSWGDRVGRDNANCDGCGGAWDGSRTAPVGTFAANAFGLHDMHGNVWEWVQDCYHGDLGKVPGDGRAFNAEPCELRVVRGGSWLSEPDKLRSASRDRLHGVNRYSIAIGFRVARDLE